MAQAAKQGGSMSYMVLVSIWIAMAVAVAALAIYRAIVARKEDDFLHVRDADVQLTETQAIVDRQLSLIDIWGKALTAAVVVYGLILAGLYVYQKFLRRASGVVVAG
jgi:hypothetical protein